MMSEIKTVLHPTDFSENARYAFETACAMARDNNATLIVLHVMMPSAAPLLSEPIPNPLQSIESQGISSQFPWPQPSDPKTRVEHRLAEGNFAEEILKLPVDLIVMGTHGRTGLGRFLTGSVAEEVLRKSTCPVLVVKIPLRPAHLPESESIANAGEVVDVLPRGVVLAAIPTRNLVHASKVDVVRINVCANQEVAGPKSNDETVVYCLGGSVSFTDLGKTQKLDAGQLVTLQAAEVHLFKGIEQVSLLLMITRHA